ncbi:hypothetical protein [Humibacillus xanthopallidus]|uniref:hypothetical protein n=1 Tax=Humibacillus xanthopallidus TaxID=412689 RepID=UPI00384E8D82
MGRDLGINAGGAVLGGGVLALLGQPLHYSVPVGLLIVCCGGLYSLHKRLHLRPVRIVVLALLGLATVIGAFLLLRPSESLERAQAQSESICSDGMWTRTPTCYESAVTYLADHIDQYAPDQWHSWDDLRQSANVPLRDFARQGPYLSTLDVASVGEVLATQELGGQTVLLQLRALTAPQLASIDTGEAELAFGQGFADSLVATREKNTLEMVYCNATVRPFFTAQPGEILAFKGVLLANGLTRDIVTQRDVQMSYVQCSAVEHMPAAKLGPPNPSVSPPSS